MYARNVTLHLKANKGADFTRTLENEVLPTLRELDIGLVAYSPLGRGF